MLLIFLFTTLHHPKSFLLGCALRWASIKTDENAHKHNQAKFHYDCNGETTQTGPINTIKQIHTPLAHVGPVLKPMKTHTNTIRQESEYRASSFIQESEYRASSFIQIPCLIVFRTPIFRTAEESTLNDRKHCTKRQSEVTLPFN